MKISEHYWKCLRTAEYLWKSGHLWKCLNIAGQLGKSLIVCENVWISLKISENYHFNSETVWKPLLARLIAEWFDLCFVDFLWTKFKETPEEKE